MTVRDFSTYLQRFGRPDLASRLPLCVAHRGASDVETENTLAAFARASELGADMWELDTQLTRDGVVMVSHDDHLGRVFGVDVRISECTADELAALDGVDVPSFAAVAALARDLGAGLYIELKAKGTGLKCWHELIQHDQRFAVFGSFDPAQIRELGDSGCDWPRAVLVGLGYDPLLLANAAGADIVHLCWEMAGDRPQDTLTPALLADIFASGREIVLWHEERLSVLQEIRQLPVLGICTNQPDLMTTAPLGTVLHA